MTNYTEKREELLHNWLEGTACHGYKRTAHWVPRLDPRFVVLKHWPHTIQERNSKYCGVYYALYDLEPLPDVRSPLLLCEWHGRWLRKYEGAVRELCAIAKTGKPAAHKEHVNCEESVVCTL